MAVFYDKVQCDYIPDCPELNDPDAYQQVGVVHTHVSVLNYQSIMSLEDYLKGIKDLYFTDAQAYERNVCYMLSQIVSGILYVNDQGCPMKVINKRDILIVTPNGYDEKLVVINPFGYQQFKATMNFKAVSDQVNKLALLFLQLNIPHETKDVYKRVPQKTTYSKGIRKVVQTLSETNDLQGLLTVKDLLEFLLWGPHEDEIKALTLAENREEAFAIWLEIERCKIVNKYAVEQPRPSVEECSVMMFLCSASGSSLFDTTKLLFV